ncbi:flagellar protein FlgN [Aliiglaciecola sp. LCG003]|uniref:flagellar protein FlgN n=1 Tax=Aliiglaciecola sp. LCG003 TaxID=3053655 RepID=UPI00257364F4|nr:flagellar protein FlgN [Aliiglaciecola sp. LCG003]WJG10544.1 flagellar protein FlgN [Aliiglaciecola sp. LCG003]
MKNLISILEKQKGHFDQLIELLDSELHLISSRDAEALIHVINDKTELLEQISVTDKAVESAFELAEDPMQNAQVIELFKQINLNLSQCKFRTEINQKAVEQGQLRLEHLRSLLLESRAKESMTYDKSGKPKGGNSSKSVSA